MIPAFRKIILFLAFLILSNHVYAQSTADAGAYSIVEKSDWRRYDNGKYTGLVRNETRGSIIPREASLDVLQEITSESTFYRGNFFVLQSTLRDMRHSAQAVDAIIPVSFEITNNGLIEIEDDRGFPMMRGFPSFLNQNVTLGAKWRTQGKRAVDPFNTGEAIIIPFIAEYEYRGIEDYNGVTVYRLSASYGFNYTNPVQPHPYVRVMGSHRVDILIRAADGLPVFMRDSLTDTYTLNDRSTVEFRGFTLTFYTNLVPLDREKEITELEEKLIPVKPEEKTPDIDVPDIELLPVPEGIKLTIKNIQFIADSPQFLPSEVARLDLVAEALKKIPDRTFLVEGHTASTGQTANEMQLSIDRAISTINELVKRGISADRFIYKGWGGTKPVGDNATDEGRRANRRVEITILE